MDAQRDRFETLLEEHIRGMSQKKQNNYLITKETYDSIVITLQQKKGEKCFMGSKFKFWAKNNFKIEQLGNKHVLYCLKTSQPVVTKEDCFETIKKCHERVGHSGRTKTWDDIRSNYSWVRHPLIQLYISTCAACSTRVPVKNPPAGKPIISLGFLTRVQMDLIDMTSRPDGEKKWILHMRDHFSKFSWTHALESKRAVEVAEALLKTFCLFGCPKILQSDNGKEFTAAVIHDLSKLWPGMTIIHGRPRHPQSQGCVERANGDLQLKLGKWLEEHPDCGWVEGIKFVTYAINTSTSMTTKKSPYEVVFGQNPRSNCVAVEIMAEQGLVNEDDIPCELIENSSDGVDNSTVSSQLNESPPVLDDYSGQCMPVVDSIENDPSTSVHQISESSLEVTTSIDASESSIIPNHRGVKRGREQQLLQDNIVVASGTQILNTTTQDPSGDMGIFQISEVYDSLFSSPEHTSDTSKPISQEQFVQWDINNTTDDSSDNPHTKNRKIATDNYLKAANKQQINFDSKQLSNTNFIEGDTVGIRIHEVDRTNTDARILPCRVLNINENNNTNSKLYKLYTASGILKNSIPYDELIDLRNVCFSALRDIDPTVLPEISLIQASRHQSNWNAMEKRDKSMCNCVGSCTTMKCSCYKSKLPCSTKCHKKKTNSCKNKS